VTTRDYLQASRHQPQLFIQAPATIIRHIHLILDLFDEGVFALPCPRPGHTPTAAPVHPHAPILGYLLTHPTLLCLEDKNLQLRRIYWEITGAPASSIILTRSRGMIERDLMRHLGHDDPDRPVPRDANPVLRGLIRDGYIKSAKLES
jgi:hypothetical protein